MNFLRAKKSINYGIYTILYRIRNWSFRRIPAFMVTKHKSLGNSLEIGITTYIDRYDKFFKPLYQQIKRLFPEVRIRITVNGFYDEFEQREYLKRIQDELCSSLGENITFVLHDKPKGLTRLWNEILSQNTTDYTLILNDDLEIFPWFRRWLEVSCWKSSHITLLEGTWSHFLISRRSVEDIGWFDEEFQGFGFEDMDYTARCLASEVSLSNIRCPYVQHRDHKPMRTSFDEKSSIIWEKYSRINRDHFFKKWKVCSYNNGIFIKQIGKYVESTGYVGKVTTPEQLSFNRGVCYPDRLEHSIGK